MALKERIEELEKLLKVKEKDTDNRSYWASWPNGIARAELYQVDVMGTGYKDYKAGDIVMVFDNSKAPNAIFGTTYKAIATQERIEDTKRVIADLPFLGHGVIIEHIHTGAIVAWIPEAKK